MVQEAEASGAQALPASRVASAAAAASSSKAADASSQAEPAAASANTEAEAQLAKYSGGESDFLEPILGSESPYEEYLRQSRRHGRSPAFYLLAAQALHATGRPIPEVLRVATNTLELGADDPQLLRSLGYLLLHLGSYAAAVEIFEKVSDLASEEPLSHLDLALALFFHLRQSPPPEASRRRAVLRRAAARTAKVITGTWPSRFPEIEWPALLALNWIVSYGVHIGLAVEDTWPADLPLDETFRFEVRSNLLAWLSWDTDHTDIDLHVVEPGGEEVYYGHRFSRTGGRVSLDFTDGYGPEVYMNADAPAGPYRVKAKYFSSHQVSKATGATCAVLWHVTGLGDFARERLAVSMVRMNRCKQMQDVFEAEVPEAQGGDLVATPSAALSADGAFFADDATARAASLASVRNVLDACRVEAEREDRRRQEEACSRGELVVQEVD